MLKNSSRIISLVVNQKQGLLLKTVGKFAAYSCYTPNHKTTMHKPWNNGFYKTQPLHTSVSCCENNEDEEKDDDRDPIKDRTKVISVEVSQQYLESEAYKTTYGNEPVWVKYRRNFKGQFAPKKTRLTCIEEGMIITGNPCPVCRDEYLVVDYRNVKLLKQFISPYTDRILPWSKTNICQEQQLKIEVAIEKSRMYGLLPFYVPFREYEYEDYYNPKNA